MSLALYHIGILMQHIHVYQNLVETPFSLKLISTYVFNKEIIK